MSRSASYSSTHEPTGVLEQRALSLNIPDQNIPEQNIHGQLAFSLGLLRISEAGAGSGSQAARIAEIEGFLALVDPLAQR
jgi:hypothetical protein